MDPVDLTLRLTLLILIVSPGPGEHWIVAITTGLLAMAGVLQPALLRSRRYWFLIAAVMLSVNAVYNWEFSDNHKFLISFWCLAVACSLSSANPREALAVNGRLLVGLCFLFATLWKLTSSTYLDSSMFHLLLLTDSRFFVLGETFAGMTPDMLQYNQLELSGLQSTLVGTNLITKGVWTTGVLQAGSGVPGFALFLTWWTLLIEGLLAVVFLMPARLLPRWRHVILLIFAVTTYPPSNVIQFGWVLLVMGLAACQPEDRRLRLGYTAAFLFIFIFSTGGIRDAYFHWLQQ